MIFLFIFLISMGNKDIEVTCSDAELQKYANTPADFIEMHRATGVILNIQQNDKYYIVLVNKYLWDILNSEQRQLIRCSVSRIAKSKGVKGGIINPVNNERLY